MIPTISDLWGEFRKSLPRNVSKIQVSEMRKAFYFGFYACLMICSEIAEQIEDEDKAAEEMEKYHVQCRKFFEMLKKGIIK